MIRTAMMAKDKVIAPHPRMATVGESWEDISKLVGADGRSRFPRSYSTTRYLVAYKYCYPHSSVLIRG
jgi:hypothetical protein